MQWIKYTENVDTAIQLMNLLLKSNLKKNKNKQTLDYTTKGDRYAPNNLDV